MRGGDVRGVVVLGLSTMYCYVEFMQPRSGVFSVTELMEALVPTPHVVQIQTDTPRIVMALSIAQHGRGAALRTGKAGKTVSCTRARMPCHLEPGDPRGLRPVLGSCLCHTGRRWSCRASHIGDRRHGAAGQLGV